MKAVMIISPRLNISFLKNFKVFIDAGYGSSGKPFTLYSEENKRFFFRNMYFILSDPTLIFVPSTIFSFLGQQKYTLCLRGNKENVIKMYVLRSP